MPLLYRVTDRDTHTHTQSHREPAVPERWSRSRHSDTIILIELHAAVSAGFSRSMASTVARTSKRGGWFLLFFHRCFVVYWLPLLHYDWLRLRLAFTSAIAWVLVYSGRGVFLSVLTMTLPTKRLYCYNCLLGDTLLCVSYRGWKMY